MASRVHNPAYRLLLRACGHQARWMVLTFVCTLASALLEGGTFAIIGLALIAGGGYAPVKGLPVPWPLAARDLRGQMNASAWSLHGASSFSRPLRRSRRGIFLISSR